MLICVSTISALILFNFGNSLATVTGNKELTFSFQAGGAVAGFLIVFWFSVRVIERLYGVKSLSSEELKSIEELLVFRDKIKGCWWQKLDPDTPCALSFIIISPKTTAYTLKLDGWAYNRQGKFVTKFTSESAFIDLNEKRILYTWKRKGSKPYEGFGHIDFIEIDGEYKVKGFFLDITYSDLKKTKLFNTDYWRPEKDEQKLMLKADKESSKGSISELIQIKMS